MEAKLLLSVIRSVEWSARYIFSSEPTCGRFRVSLLLSFPQRALSPKVQGAFQATLVLFAFFCREKADVAVAMKPALSETNLDVLTVEPTVSDCADDCERGRGP